MNTLGIETRDAAQDFRREPLNFDAPTPWECVAEAEHDLKMLREDGIGVPPWMTLDEAIADAEAQLDRYREWAELAPNTWSY